MHFGTQMHYFMLTVASCGIIFHLFRFPVCLRIDENYLVRLEMDFGSIKILSHGFELGKTPKYVGL